jgi:hypothetical protein
MIQLAQNHRGRQDDECILWRAKNNNQNMMCQYTYIHNHIMDGWTDGQEEDGKHEVER